MKIVTRNEWGARPPSRPLIAQPTPEELFLHHSFGYGQGGASYMRQMQDQHQAKGWRDIAYNWALDPKTGAWYEGRGALKIPGAQASYNTGTAAICVMGNHHTQPVNWRVVEWLADFMRYSHAMGWGPAFITGGHRDAPKQATVCPGDMLHARIPEVNALIHHTPAGGGMPYRNFINCPTERDANGRPQVADWAMAVVDWALATGKALPTLTYDWEKPLTDGRYLTMEYRDR